MEYITKEPYVYKQEHTMGFFTNTTQLFNHSIYKYEQRMLFIQAMDLNCLTWILAIFIKEK